MLNDEIRDNFPFVSVVKYGKQEIVGIVINQDIHITSIYDYNMLHSNEEKQQLVEWGDVWWWESNRTIPINLFLKHEMEQFKYVIKTLNTKDVELILGPTTNLHNLSAKKMKRKTIHLVRNFQTLSSAGQ